MWYIVIIMVFVMGISSYLIFNSKESFISVPTANMTFKIGNRSLYIYGTNIDLTNMSNFVVSTEIKVGDSVKKVNNYEIDSVKIYNEYNSNGAPLFQTLTFLLETFFPAKNISELSNLKYIKIGIAKSVEDKTIMTLTLI